MLGSRRPIGGYETGHQARAGAQGRGARLSAMAWEPRHGGSRIVETSLFDARPHLHLQRGDALGPVGGGQVAEMPFSEIRGRSRIALIEGDGSTAEQRDRVTIAAIEQ